MEDGEDASVSEEECKWSKIEDGEDANVEANSKSNIYLKNANKWCPIIVPQLMDDR